MKKSFFALVHTIRKFTQEYKDELLTLIYIAWIITSIIICYNYWPNTYSTNDMPNEQAYTAYENIITKIVDENITNIRNVKVPDNTDISLSLDKITISNNNTYYSVTGNIRETTKIKFTRESGSSIRMFERILWGSIILGGIVLGVCGGMILYIIFYVIFFLLKLFINFICNFIHEYKNEKKTLYR